MKARVKDWQDHQHYKDRSPPWIKLHRSLLDDYKFHCLPVASRAIAPLLWLLASDDSGMVNIDPDFLSFRLRMTPEEADAAIKPLINKGWLEPVTDASAALAPCKHSACLETEVETETEAYKAEKEKPLSDKSDASDGPDYEKEFQEVWQARPPRKNESKRAALKAYTARRRAGAEYSDILAGVERYRAYIDNEIALGNDARFTKHLATFLGPDGWYELPWEPNTPVRSLTGTQSSDDFWRSAQ